jgi:hypothetical protein
VRPSPGVGRLEKSPSPHLLSPQKISVQKIKFQKIGQREEEKDLEVVKKVTGKGKKISIFI